MNSAHGLTIYPGLRDDRTQFYTNMRPAGFSQAQQRGAGSGQPQAQQASNPLVQLFGFLPVILLLFFTFFGSQPDPVRIGRL